MVARPRLRHFFRLLFLQGYCLRSRSVLAFRQRFPHFLVALWWTVSLNHYLCLNQLKTCYDGKIKQDRQVDTVHYRRA